MSDDNKKAAYDRYGHAAFEQSAGGFGGGWRTMVDFGGFEDVDLGDIFGSFFGGGSHVNEEVDRCEVKIVTYN